MKRLILILLASLVVGGCDRDTDGSRSDASVESGLDLVFVANEGVLVRTATNSVLIDALFTRPNPAYAAPPPEMLVQMEAGQPPFDAVNLVLVTHNHPDHLDPTSAARFLRRNASAVLVAPEDAVAAIRDSAAQWTAISDRVVSIALEPGTSTDTTIEGISVTAYRTLHSGQREDPQNLMYLIEMDGRAVFHEGDSDGHPDTFGRFDIGERHIDLALVHFWFPTDLDAERTLKEIIKADHVGLFHLPINMTDDAPATIAQVAGNYPDMFLLRTRGERKAFPR